MAYGFHLKKLP